MVSLAFPAQDWQASIALQLSNTQNVRFSISVLVNQLEE